MESNALCACCARCRLHFIFTYLYTFYGVWLLYHHFLQFAQLRLRYLSRGTRLSAAVDLAGVKLMVGAVTVSVGPRLLPGHAGDDLSFFAEVLSDKIRSTQRHLDDARAKQVSAGERGKRCWVWASAQWRLRATVTPVRRRLSRRLLAGLPRAPRRPSAPCRSASPC